MCSGSSTPGNNTTLGRGKRGSSFASITISLSFCRRAHDEMRQSRGARSRETLWRLTYIELPCITALRMDMGKDLIAASATPLVLAILAEGDSYGYAIIKRVAEMSGGHLQWTDGMLYPVLD